MNDTMSAAVLGAFATVLVGLLASFFAEDYRRWRDAGSIAAAIAGELGSYRPAKPLLRQMFSTWAHATAHGNRETLTFRRFERPTDVVFDALVSKIGHLEPALTEAIAYVYGNLRGMRAGMAVVMEEHGSMSDDELVARAHACIDALDRAFERGDPLVADLKRRSEQNWRPWPISLIKRGGRK